MTPNIELRTLRSMLPIVPYNLEFEHLPSISLVSLEPPLLSNAQLLSKLYRNIALESKKLLTGVFHLFPLLMNIQKTSGTPT